MRLSAIFICLLPLFGCAHAHRHPDSIAIDSRAVLLFEDARKDESTAKSPALYRFQKGDRTLLYLASSHSTDPNSDTFQLVRYVFKSEKPDVAIAEGFETRLGFNPKGVFERASRGETEDFYPDGEPSFIMEQAKANGTPVIGGEPSDQDVYKALVSKGYSANDMIGFYFVRRIPQIRRSGEVKDMASLERSFTNYSKAKARDVGIQNFKFSFEEFKDWYSTKQGKELGINAGEKGETAPIDGHYFTQQLSRIITTIRDEHILTTISDMLNKYPKVFIAYGSSHYRIEHRALKAALGEPKELGLKGDQ